MIKLENTEVVGLKAALRGMRNPMNSWEKSDTYETYVEDSETAQNAPYQLFVGEEDKSLAKRLAAAGTDHSKFMRMIAVYVDITAPLYWFKEFDTYKVGTVANSCSTMHKIHSKEFGLDDFSIEHLMDSSLCCLEDTIEKLNFWRVRYILQSDPGHFDPSCANSKDCWWQMIQLLPSSYNQRRTVMLNYQVLQNIYHARKNHKLDEWRQLCQWIESLPHSDLITE